MKLKHVPDDPKVLLRALLKAYKHIDDRNISMTQMRLLTAVLLLTADETGGTPIRAIAKETGLTRDVVREELISLVESRHIHEIVPTFGDRFLYKLGAVGQSFANSIRRTFEDAQK